MSLRIDHLVAYGLSGNAIAQWKSRHIDELLPLQEEALVRCGLLNGKNLLVSAPTSSGKTLIAEIAALRHLESRRRAVYLVPTRSLAEEKYRTFRDQFGPLGIRVAISTRERPDADRTVVEGRYDLLVAVYEKMKAYLVVRPQILRDVALIVVDEVQMIGEPDRGATLDILLTKIITSPYSPQMLGLSAVLGDDAARLADWMHCELLTFAERPIELREGVVDLSSGLFLYRSAARARVEEEPLVDPWSDAEDLRKENEDTFQREAILRIVRALAEDKGEQVIVFVPTRSASQQWAVYFSQHLALPESAEALRNLAQYEDTRARERLHDVFRTGVAFHNADVPRALRALVERHFNDGAIRVLVSTSTLGQGVNLAGRNVVQVPSMVTTDRWTGRQAFAALSRSRFRNQGGRGARMGREERFGRSILVASTRIEAERLLREYVEGPLEGILPQVDPKVLDRHAIDLVVSGIANRVEDLRSFFLNSFSGRIFWRVDGESLDPMLEMMIEQLIRRRFLSLGDAGRIEGTGMGEVAATSGLDLATVELLAEWFEQNPSFTEDDPFEALIVLAFTADGRDYSLAGFVPERGSAARFVEPIRERLLSRDDVTALVQEILSPPGGLTRDAIACLRKILVLDAWIGTDDTRDIEETQRTYSGAVANMALHFAWLAQGAAALGESLTRPEKECRALRVLADRLVLGCSVEGIGLARLRVDGLSRAHVGALIREGFTTPESIALADPDMIRALVPEMVANELLAESTALYEGRSARHRREMPEFVEEIEAEIEEPALDHREEIPEEHYDGDSFLELDLRGTGSAKLNGRDLNLPPLAFRLLAALAERPGTGLRYEEAEGVLWPDAHVERQQVHAHRNRIVEAFCEVIGPERASGLMALKRGMGLLLAIPKENIRTIR
jgi:helicase